MNFRKERYPKIEMITNAPFAEKLSRVGKLISRVTFLGENIILSKSCSLSITEILLTKMMELQSHGKF